MYTLLLICAMAIGQDKEENAFDLDNSPISRHFVLANGKLTEFRAKFSKQDIYHAITNIGDRHVLSIAVHAREQISKAEKYLTEQNYIDKDQAASVIRLRPGTWEGFSKSFDIKKLSAIYDPASNALLVVGSPAEVGHVESLAETAEIRQEKPIDPQNVMTQFELARDRVKELVVAMKELGTRGITIAYTDSDNGPAIVTGPTRYIEQVKKALAEKGLLTSSKQTQVFPLSHADATKVAAHLNTLEINDARISVDARTNMLMVHGNKDAIDRVTSLLKELDKQAEAPKPVSTQRVGRSLPTVSGKSEEIRAAIEALKVKGLEFGFTKANDTNVLWIEGSSEAEIDVIEEVLNKLGLVFIPKKFKVFQLKYQPAEQVTNSLAFSLGAKQNFVPDARLNRIVVSGDKEFFKRVEELIAKLDVANPEAATQSPGRSDPPTDMKIFRLQHIAADSALALLKQLKIESLTVAGEAQTNSVIVRGTGSEIALVEALLANLDRVTAKPDPASSRTDAPKDSPLGTLWTEFAKAEAKSITTAGEVRTAATKLGDKHPTLIDLKNKLETEVKVAFNLRHRLQQAEAQELRRQLTEIESRLQKREKNEPAIIKARVDSLLKMDELGWEAMTKPKGSVKPEEMPAEETPINKPTAEQVAAAERIRKSGTPRKEKLEAWERVDREEYVGVKVASSLGGIGGGFGSPPGANTAPAPISMQYQHGALICGNAMIRDSYGALQSDQVVWFGDKQLPCRLAAVAPFSIHAYRSSRFPTLGITDFTHKSKEGEQVWAFIPNQSETLVKAKVFRKSGAEFAIDEEISFGIEAEGKLETGYLVCTDQGDFLGIVSYNNGSLGACWSAPAIGDWLQRTNMETPDPADPFTGRVIIALPGSHYLPVRVPGGPNQAPKPGRAFYGSIVNGVIITHPQVSTSDLQKSGKILYGPAGASLTIDKMKLSEDGRFTFIWCKELTPKSGFTSAHDLVHRKEFAIPLGTRAHSFNGSPDDEALLVAEPLKDELGSFQFAQQNRSAVSQSDEKGFELEWFGSFNSVGVPVTSAGGHFLGVVDGDKDVILNSSQQFQEARQHHTVHVISADEILRIVEEETKKLPIEKPIEPAPLNPEAGAPTLPAKDAP